MSRMMLDSGVGIYLFYFTHPKALAAVCGPGLDDHHPVLQWTSQGIVAGFSKVVLEEWIGVAGATHLQDLTWVGPRACRHEVVIERVMHHAPVFPVPFGTLFSSLERLDDLLHAQGDTIAAFLDFMADKEEWAVKGLLDREKAEVSLLVSEPQPAMLPSSQGMGYLLERRRRTRVGLELRTWVKTVREAVAEELQEYAVDFRTLKMLPRKASGRNRDMVCNWAFLLKKNNREAFQTRVEQLGVEYEAQGLMLELSGPLPPYRFCPSLKEEGRKPKTNGRPD